MIALSESLDKPPHLFYGLLFVFRMWLSLTFDASILYFLVSNECLRVKKPLLIYVTMVLFLAIFITSVAFTGRDLYSYANELMIGFKFFNAVQSCCLLCSFSRRKFVSNLPTLLRFVLCFEALLCSYELIALLMIDASQR